MGRPSSKQRKPYNSDAIADLAVRVFLKHGYDGASLDDVARAAGITKASIYYHVRGKEDLLTRGVGRAFDALEKAFHEQQATHGPAVKRLRYLIGRTIEIAIEMQPEVALLLRVRGNTRAERAIVERRRALDRLAASYLARAQRAHELRDDIDPGLAARLVFGMLNSVIEWYRPGGTLSPAEIIEAAYRLVFEGLTVRRKSRS